MQSQTSLAHLDLSELEDAIPIHIKSIILISNAELHLSTQTLQRLKEESPCLSNRPEITKINTNWLSTLEQQEKYTNGKRPSTGFYTRKLFAAIKERRPKLRVCTLGFKPDASYWNSRTVTHHDYVFESNELIRSAIAQHHYPLDEINIPH